MPGVLPERYVPKRAEAMVRRRRGWRRAAEWWPVIGVVFVLAVSSAAIPPSPALSDTGTGVVPAASGAAATVAEDDVLLPRPALRAPVLQDGLQLDISTDSSAPPLSLDEVAAEVLAGRWGTGSDRVQRLSAAGYNPSAVQAKVNVLVAGSSGTAVKGTTTSTKAATKAASAAGSSSTKASSSASSTKASSASSTKASSASSTKASSSSGSSGQGSSTPTSTKPKAEPNRLVIPAIGVNAPLKLVGLNGSEVAVPASASTVGRYKNGVDPCSSTQGTILLAGHVSYGGKRGALSSLSSLGGGALAYIGCADGSVSTWRVTSRQVVAADAFPSDMFRRNGALRLAITTCTGPTSASGHHSQNLIVTFERI